MKINIVDKYNSKNLIDVVINIGFILMNIGLVLKYKFCMNKDTSLVLILPLILIFSIIVINYTISFLRNKFDKKNLIQYVICLLLGIYTSLSFTVLHYENYKISTALIVLFSIGYIINFSILFLAISHLLSKINHKRYKNKMHWWDLIIFMIFPLIIGTVALLGVYPAATSYDTSYCWSSALRTSYTDSHPIMYVLLLRGLSLIWEDIAIVSIFQILLVSFTYGYTAYRLKEVGVNTKLCYTFVIIATLIPSNLLTNLVIWKDIPYTMFLILFCVEILRLFTNPNYLDKFRNYILIFVFCFGIICTRHNGLYAVLFSLLVLLTYIIKKKYKVQISRVLCLLLALLLIFICTKDFAINNVRRFEEHPFNIGATYSNPAQGLVQVYYNHYDEMDNTEKGVLSKYLNIEKTEKYIQDRSYWQFHGKAQLTLNIDKLKNNGTDFMRTYFHYLNLYPEDIIMSYLRATAITWSISEYSHTEYPPLDAYISKNPDVIMQKQHIISKESRSILEFLLQTKNSEILKIIFWRPALIFILLMLLIASSKKIVPTIFIALPAILNHFSYFASIEGQPHRYFYVYYTMILFIYLINSLKLDLKIGSDTDLTIK